MIENKPSSPLPEPGKEEQEKSTENQSSQSHLGWQQLWQKLLKLGLGETTLRVLTGAVVLILMLLIVWVMGRFFLTDRTGSIETMTPVASTEAQTTLISPINTAESVSVSSSSYGITRQAQIHTNLPSHPRDKIITYTVQKGDTLFGIADNYGLKPESLLWSNKYILGDNPDNLVPGLEINIPPQDGAIYQWQSGDGLNGVAKFFEVTPEDIINWSGNDLDPNTLGDWSLPNIPVGTMLFIPNGIWEYTDWLPHITRDTPASSTTAGPGYCGIITEGAYGTGTFIWPSTEKWLSGYDYTSIHHGIDIAGAIGNQIYATDSGVVVYAGWNNNGYGNLIVLDHGNGWQSVYAHLDSMNVACGDSVEQWAVIGYMGTTGNSSGPHLHFELRLDGSTVNPWDFLIR